MTKDPITYGMNDQEVVATMLTHLQWSLNIPQVLVRDASKGATMTFIKSAHQKVLMETTDFRTDQKLSSKKCSQYSCVQKKEQSGHRKSLIRDENK